MFERSQLNSSQPFLVQPTPAWLTFLQPQLFPPDGEEFSCLPPPVAAYHLLMCAAAAPAPDWPLLVRVSLNLSIYTLIFKHTFNKFNSEPRTSYGTKTRPLL